jgi:signal transduction histidine kinase
MLFIDRAQQLAIEQERNRSARDIHDTVAQSMFEIIFSLDACIQMLPDQVDEVKDELAELHKLAQNVRDEVRHSIFNLWPSRLTIEQFTSDILSYAASCASTEPFQVDFESTGNFDGLPAIIRRTLYRITQETITNTTRHSGVHASRIRLKVLAHEAVLDVQDEGRGFDPDLVLSRSHNREKFGLHGIQERASRLGGSCSIESSPGNGTHIRVRVPLRSDSSHG